VRINSTRKANIQAFTKSSETKKNSQSKRNKKKLKKNTIKGKMGRELDTKGRI